MKIELKIRNTRTEHEFTESFDIGDQDPQEFAEGLINNFNDSLYPGSAPRELLSWKETEDATPFRIRHDWEKTSLVTEAGGYDRMRCRNCGITGKRYGLGEAGVMRDRKFKHLRFEDCAKAKAFLERRAERERRKNAVQEIHWKS